MAHRPRRCRQTNRTRRPRRRQERRARRRATAGGPRRGSSACASQAPFPRPRRAEPDASDSPERARRPARPSTAGWSPFTPPVSFPRANTSTRSTQYGGLEPAVAQLEQPLSFQGYSPRTRFLGVVLRPGVRRQAGRLRERLEGGPRRVARAVFQTRPEAKGPDLVEPAVQDTEARVVIGAITISWKSWTDPPPRSCTEICRPGAG